MGAAQAKLLVTSWNTIRYELLNTRISDLKLKIEGSPVEPMIRQVRRELDAKGVKFMPVFYLTDSWGCPDEVPAVGVPFYLADRRLARIEEEQTGEIEDLRTTMMYLRHEVGHALNYAYRLWEWPGWADTFGKFSKPYRDVFLPDPSSRDFVRHLVHSQYGRSYAQKHPDEDFSETFAIWLTPRSGWRRKYRFWPALRKLSFVANLMRGLKNRPVPVVASGSLLNPVESMTMILAEHYGQRAERYRAAAQGYVDDKLSQVFTKVRSNAQIPASQFIRKHRNQLVTSINIWSGLDADEVATILDKLSDRARFLNLKMPRRKGIEKLVEVTSLATSLAKDFAYTGRFTG
ncbi:MAG: hypothetical protein WCI20_09600 [bacterium]